jgi:hypothetical protein
VWKRETTSDYPVIAHRAGAITSTPAARQRCISTEGCPSNGPLQHQQAVAIDVLDEANGAVCDSMKDQPRRRRCHERFSAAIHRLSHRHPTTASRRFESHILAGPSARQIRSGNHHATTRNQTEEV